jgi:hypothetical protein
MKFSKIASFALLSASVSADLASMQKLYQQVLDIKKNGTDERVRATGASTRFVPGVRFVFSMIQEYGCWCYLGDRHGGGRGQPQDSYDKICQKLHHGMTCASAIENCDPHNQQYQILAESDTNGDMLMDCETLNVGDECAAATCNLEAHFTSEFIQETFSGTAPNLNDYSLALGFDTAQCNVAPNCAAAGTCDSEFTEVCCGTYSDNTRRPIKILTGETKECCESGVKGRFTVFNPLVNSCCDGQVESIGSC